MPSYLFRGILQNEKWVENACITLNNEGIITDISTDPQTGAEKIDGYALPGFQNAHSHAFQYAMAGVAENSVRGAEDNFWTWRELMYKIALSVGADELESVAAMAYAEMIRHGYTHVAEFHYLHHGIDGKPYSHLAEHGGRLVSAAEKAGIKITLIPVFYQKGGFNTPPQQDQRRFIIPTVDDYLRLLESTLEVTNVYRHASAGFGVHSIRAAGAEEIIRIYNEGPRDLPFHMHIAEQLREVEDAVHYLKQRPVEWILDHLPVDQRFHLVHATHLSDAECESLTKTGAHVVLCPSTEGNLGDGLFPLKRFLQQNGSWSIGSDSHIQISPMEDLRWLDYGQRLITHKRNSYATGHSREHGWNAYHQSLMGGRQAMGNNEKNYISIGQSLDVVVFDAGIPLINITHLDHLLSTIIYSGDVSWILGTMTNGQWRVRQQQHINKETIQGEFNLAMSKLKIR